MKRIIDSGEIQAVWHRQRLCGKVHPGLVNVLILDRLPTVGDSILTSGMSKKVDKVG